MCSKSIFKMKKMYIYIGCKLIRAYIKYITIFLDQK